MKNEAIKQCRARIQGYIEKIDLIKKSADDDLIFLIDFIKECHESKKDFTNVFISIAEDTRNELNMDIQIESLLSDDENMEQDEEIEIFLSSLKEFSIKTKLYKSEIDSELSGKIKKVVEDFDEAIHEEIDSILELIAREQRKIEEIQNES
ncbi:MAG: hypothetical protein NTU81_02995 [Candidatus Nomurabacteria bacterium]|nr:hypothetical protein [Candidatus Nomurabacteria bacterium]